MAKPITPFSITAPGFYGLNTQDSPVDMDKGFALQASNCIIDRAGRVASRKGWVKASTASAGLSTANIECIGELIRNDGSATILAAGNNKLFKLVGTTLTELTYGGGGVAPTITASNWQFTQLSGIGLFFQRAFDTLIYDPAVSDTTYRRLSEKSGATGTFYQTHTAISAYGRIWTADTVADKNTVVFSDLLAPHLMSGGTAGSLDLRTIWPSGGDKLVGMAAHNNFLYLFGSKQILIYSDASDLFTMKLSDSIVGVGCIARDSIQTIGEDVWFLSDTGLRSLKRTIQEKSAPFKTVSKNINDDLQAYVDAENIESIKSVYSAVNNFYLLSFPSTGNTYCFDTRGPLQDESYRVTNWTNINPKAFCETRDRLLYIGRPGYLGKYSGYLDDSDAYRLQYFTGWADFGNPTQTSILKKIMLTVIGGTNQTVVFKWAYDYNQSYFSQSTTISGIASEAEYNVAEYNTNAEYSSNLSVNVLSVNGTSAGKLLQFGFEAQISSVAISMQKIDLMTKDGKL